MVAEHGGLELVVTFETHARVLDEALESVGLEVWRMPDDVSDGMPVYGLRPASMGQPT